MEGAKEIKKWAIKSAEGNAGHISLVQWELDDPDTKLFGLWLQAKPKESQPGTFENSFCEEMVQALNDALDILEEEDLQTAKALVTFSQGKIFSSGLDLSWLMAQEHGSKVQFRFMSNFHKLLARFLTFPMPTVAAINGHAFAGGFLLSLAHDYRVMNNEFGFACMSEIDIGAPLTPPLNVLLKEKLPRHFAARMMLEGGRFDAHELLANKGLDEAVRGKDVLNVAKQIAKKMAPKGASAAIREIKEDLYIDAFLALRDAWPFRSAI